MTPVFVNCYNRLTTTRTLCEQIAKLDNAVPVIIDNASDYEPLLEWYDSCGFEVLRLRENLGHHAPWLSGVVNQFNADWYVVTDCDLDIAGVPADVLEHLKNPFAATRVSKVGLSLEINDLPDWQSEVRTHESRFWRKRNRTLPEFFDAAVDTTFAMYRRNRSNWNLVFNSMRADRPYTARHVPWYLDCEKLDEENKNYFATAGTANSWKPNGMKLSSRFSKAYVTASLADK